MSFLKYVDVAIIGGGVSGAFTAYELSSHDLNISILEKSNEVDGATSRSGGIVTRMMDNPMDSRLAARSIELIRETIGDDEGIIHPGYLCIEEVDDVEEDYKKFKDIIPDLKVMDRDEIVDRWSYIKLYDDELGLYAPTDFTVEPDKMLEKLWTLLEDKGIEVNRGVEVRDVIFNDKRHLLNISSDRKIYADKIVFAAGAWNKEILEKHGVDLNVFIIGIPIFKFSVDSREFIGIWDEKNYSYWRPSYSSTWIGGAYDSYPIEKADEGFSKPSETFEENILRIFKYRFRFRKWRLIDSWSGPISISKDYKPILKKIDLHNGLYILDGLGGRGLMRGPALGEKLAGIILTDE